VKVCTSHKSNGGYVSCLKNGISGKLLLPEPSGWELTYNQISGNILINQASSYVVRYNHCRSLGTDEEAKSSLSHRFNLDMLCQPYITNKRIMEEQTMDNLKVSPHAIRSFLKTSTVVRAILALTVCVAMTNFAAPLSSGQAATGSALPRAPPTSPAHGQATSRPLTATNCL
jgi:hypothetical protein